MHKLLEASGLAAVVFPDGNKTNWMLLHLRSLVKPSNLPQELLFPAKRYSWTLWHLEILSSPSSVPKVLFCLIKLQSLEIESSQLTILLKFSIPGLPHNLAIAFTSLAYSMCVCMSLCLSVCLSFCLSVCFFHALWYTPRRSLLQIICSAHAVIVLQIPIPQDAVHGRS